MLNHFLKTLKIFSIFRIYVATRLELQNDIKV